MSYGDKILSMILSTSEGDGVYSKTIAFGILSP